MSAKKRHSKKVSEPEGGVEEPKTPEADGEDTPETGAPVEAPVAAEEGEVPVETVRDAALEEKLQQAEARAAEYLDGLQRERAAFQNYKKRVERERADQAQVMAGNLLAKLLPVLDDFDRAVAAVPGDARNQWFDGVALIQRKFEKFLEDQGVKEMKVLGEPFDPNFHEAIGVDDGSDAASGTVTQVVQRGYVHGDRVLRPALVRVAG